jgi:hypothetical protein
MNQITIKTPNPKGRLFLNINLERDFAAGLHLSEALSPLLHTVRINTYPCIYSRGRLTVSSVYKLY